MFSVLVDFTSKNAVYKYITLQRNWKSLMNPDPWIDKLLSFNWSNHQSYEQGPQHFLKTCGKMRTLRTGQWIYPEH